MQYALRFPSVRRDGFVTLLGVDDDRVRIGVIVNEHLKQTGQLIEERDISIPLTLEEAVKLAKTILKRAKAVRNEEHQK